MRYMLRAHQNPNQPQSIIIILPINQLELITSDNKDEFLVLRNHKPRDKYGMGLNVEMETSNSAGHKGRHAVSPYVCTYKFA